ncbi:PadR family transcriptional regulator [Chloroflexota bacterium]
MDNTNELDKKLHKELNTGTAALVLLSILDRAIKPMYGYQITKDIEAAIEEMPMTQGALYPVLRSLETSGLLNSEVEPSVSGPPRRYYSITKSGRETLGRWTEIWSQTKAFVDTILEGEHDDTKH